MSKIYDVRPEFARAARIDGPRYAADYARSVEDPEGFWADIGRRLAWSKPFSRAKDTSYRLEDFKIHWYADGRITEQA